MQVIRRQEMLSGSSESILHDVSHVTAAFQILVAETARFMKTGLIGSVIV